MRQVLAVIEVDDIRAIEEGFGTLDYLEREFGWLEQSGVFLGTAKILDRDDECDAKAIELANKIFKEE